MRWLAGPSVAACSVFALCAANPVFAQEVPGSAEETVEHKIVVTAQIRSENVQDVPISVAALHAARLDAANVLSVQELSRVATNFSATRNSQAASIRLAIRGVGAPGNTATEPSVAAFLDGVYVPRPGSIIGNFLDIERIEILRGPQGTLFGRNAGVGAISFHSAEPQNEFSGQMTAEAGNGDRYLVKGYVNLLLGDNVAARIAAQGSKFGGYWHNRLDGRTYGGADDYAGRLSVKGEFGNLTWLLRADYANSQGDGYAPSEFKADSVSAAQLSGFLALQNALSGASIDTVLFDRNVSQLITADYDDENWGLSSDATLALGNYSLRLIDSCRNWNNAQLDGDTIFTTVPLISRAGGYLSKSQSHELQLVSPEQRLLGGKLDFVVGLYYFDEDFTIDERVQLGSQFCNALAPASSRPTCNDLLATGAGVDATDQDFAQSLESLAVYGQANLKLADPLTLTLGGRWTREDKQASYVQRVANPFAGGLRAPENISLSLKDDRFTWRTALKYTPLDNVMLFASYSTGYKSGGFNSGAGNAALNDLRLFGRETVKNYEFGTKTNWLDDALQATLTLYRTDIDGFQDRSFDGVSFVVRNAGRLRQQGFEFDTRIAPARSFALDASLAYLDSRFTSYPGGAGLPGIGGVQDLGGTRNNYSPEFSGSVVATWSGDIGDTGLRWSMDGNIAFFSDQNNGSVTDNNRQTVQDGYALLGGRFQLKGPGERWILAVFGNNLTNKGYCSAQFYQVLDGAFGLRNGVFPGSTGVRCNVGQPRTYGVSATYSF